MVRGRPTPTRVKEQGRKITDLIKGFNAMNKDKLMEGSRNRNITPMVVGQQAIARKRKASEVVDQVENADVDRKAEMKKKCRTSFRDRSSRSEKEMSIKNYFKINILQRREVPVGEHHGQEHVPVQGVAGVNPVQGEGETFQTIRNPDVTASHYCEAADDTQYSGARYARDLVWDREKQKF